jgi:hypothetical protein
MLKEWKEDRVWVDVKKQSKERARLFVNEIGKGK